MEDRPTRVSRALAGSGVPVKGSRAYPGVIITTCTSHLGTVERVTRLLFHSTTFVPDLRMNAGLGHLEWREPHAGRPARTLYLILIVQRAIAGSLNEVLPFFRRTRSEAEMTK
ncbi:DNA topoisomerase 4 subunit B [Striga asiatica]|uniref:DNA topoisomerase 4 subunit B n=1 Tax=Striga asiatica TaxID=4170 RepID=A0A5A7QKD3_STRAF|nr:DNA topoisomerase 4 subunit B [Striga asiatica]